MKISVVMGTRPGIVKMAPVYLALREIDEFEVSIIYTGQHYSSNMKDDIVSAFDLPAPVFTIDGLEGCKTHGAQISRMMVGCEDYFISEKPSVVLVCGDANTNLAAGIAARKTDRVLCHVESGLRSRDWSMPEEHNRVMLDHISNFLFAPTAESAKNLAKESVSGEVFVVGNTVVDSLKFAIDKNILSKPDAIDLVPKDYILLTAHRQENVDDPQKLRSILEAARLLVSSGLKIVFPVHPRTAKMIAQFGLSEMIDPRIKVIDPVPYENMLWLILNASLVMTDSGGLQEEACVLGTPCVTLRENTERPESVDVGANIIAGVNASRILSAVEQFSARGPAHSWHSPFGNGNSGELIAEIIYEKYCSPSNSLR